MKPKPKRNWLLALLSNPIFFLAKVRLPKLDGELHCEGLQKPVRILRDNWGVPHIYAESMLDLFFAQGFIHAQDRLWQMDLLRRSALRFLQRRAAAGERL